MKTTARKIGFALALYATLTAPAVLAQAYNESQVLQAYRVAYQQNAKAAPAAAASKSMDNCYSDSARAQMADMQRGAQDAAREHMQTRLPPNPNNIFSNNTCLSAVQSIQIPAMPGVVGSFLNNMLKNGTTQACSMANNSWNGMLNNMMSGNTRALVNLGSQAATGNTQAIINYGSSAATQAVMGSGPSSSIVNSASQAAQQTYQQQQQQQYQQQQQQSASPGIMDRVMGLFR